MGSVDPLRITVDEEPQTLAPARRSSASRMSIAIGTDGPISADGIRKSTRATASSSSRSPASTTSIRLHRCRRRFGA